VQTRVSFDVPFCLSSRLSFFHAFFFLYHVSPALHICSAVVFFSFLSSALFSLHLEALGPVDKVCPVHWLHAHSPHSSDPSASCLYSFIPQHPSSLTMAAPVQHGESPPSQSNGPRPTPSAPHGFSFFHDTSNEDIGRPLEFPPSRTSNLSDALQALQLEQRPLSLTLGAEFEMLLVHCKYPALACGGTATNMSPGIEVLHRALSQPLKATCATCGNEHTFLLRIQRPRDAADDAYYTRWTIVEDASLNLRPDEWRVLGMNRPYCDIYRIEIRTRILSADTPLRTRPSQSQPGHVHSITYQEEVSAVLQQLKAVFNAPSGRAGNTGSWRLTINDSCSMHVHIGNEDRSFPLRTVKNVLSTCAVGERAIDALHAQPRIDGVTLPLIPQHDPSTHIESAPLFEDDVYNKSLSTLHAGNVYAAREKVSRKSKSLPYFRSIEYPSGSEHQAVVASALEYSVSAQLTLIQHAPSLDCLKDLHGGFVYSHRVAVNLENLPSPGCNSDKYTIEFRQHAGTLEAIEAVSWMDVVTGIVRHAHETSDLAFAALVKDKWQSPQADTLALLATIGCSSRTLQHYERCLDPHRTNDSHAEDMFTQETTVLTTFPIDDPLVSVQAVGIQKRHSNHSPANVRSRIAEKFRKGGYGQFPAAYLAHVDVDCGPDGDAVRERLTIGWVHPDTVTSPPGVRSSSPSASLPQTASPVARSPLSWSVDDPDVDDAIEQLYGW